MEKMNRNHSTYWIVNHWNPFKLVSTVLVIMLANLNWRIYHNYNPFILGQLEVILGISVIVYLWFEVLNWYCIFEWLDLPNLQSIRIGNTAFKFSQVFSISNLNSLQYLEIGDCSFLDVVSFEIKGLDKLKCVKIGKDSFTLVDSSDFDRDSNKAIKDAQNYYRNKAIKDAQNYYRSFRILNCESLESIEIGQFSFFDYGGGFELRNLPALQLIDFGLNAIPSAHFCYSSFVIRGFYYLIWNIIVDLPSLKTIKNMSGFPGSLSTVIESIDDQWLDSFE